MSTGSREAGETARLSAPGMTAPTPSRSSPYGGEVRPDHLYRRRLSHPFRIGISPRQRSRRLIHQQPRLPPRRCSIAGFVKRPQRKDSDMKAVTFAALLMLASAAAPFATAAPEAKALKEARAILTAESMETERPPYRPG